MDAELKLAAVKAQLAVLEAHILIQTEQLQWEQEVQEWEHQVAQTRCEEADRVEAECDIEEDLRVELVSAEISVAATPLIDMEEARAGIAQSRHKGRRIPDTKGGGFLTPRMTS